jgi:hypothetical protein
MFERNKNLLKAYFKKIISNYCLENKNQITKYKFSELLELPLAISDRFWNVIISKQENKNELQIEEYSKEIEILSKNIVVNSLIDFYNDIKHKRYSDFIFDFLDFDSKGVLIKSDVKFILKNMFIYRNKNLDNFNEIINSEIKKSFNNSKILLKKEYNDNLSEALKTFLINFFKSLKIFKNFEFIRYNCQISFPNEKYENNYINNYSNALIYLGINDEYFDNMNNNKTNDDSETNLTEEESDFSYNNEYKNLSNKNLNIKQRKMTYSIENKREEEDHNIKRKNTKKDSFQIEKPEQYHISSNNEDEKCIQKFRCYLYGSRL